MAESTQAPEPRTESGGAWARRIADTYNEIARSSKNPMAAQFNAAEASNYYGIADRMDRALPAKES